jgi:transcription elongation GreA/GreB family factor
MMVIVISKESPLAKSIFGKKINEEIFFNGKKLKIDNVV